MLAPGCSGAGHTFLLTHTLDPCAPWTYLPAHAHPGPMRTLDLPACSRTPWTHAHLGPTCLLTHTLEPCTTWTHLLAHVHLAVDGQLLHDVGPVQLHLLLPAPACRRPRDTCHVPHTLSAWVRQRGARCPAMAQSERSGRQGERTSGCCVGQALGYTHVQTGIGALPTDPALRHAGLC